MSICECGEIIEPLKTTIPHAEHQSAAWGIVNNILEIPVHLHMKVSARVLFNLHYQPLASPLPIFMLSSDISISIQYTYPFFHHIAL